MERCMTRSVSKFKKSDLTQDIVKELLGYNPLTGVLVWKFRERHWFPTERSWKWWNTTYAGKIASNIYKSSTDGYERRHIYVLGNNYTAHRIVWLWMTGVFPSSYIDHIDRDATNNKWSNLRETNPSHNNLNQSMPKDNTSGVCGVYWHKQAQKWCARVTLNGKTHSLGLFAKDDLDLAAMEILEFRAEHGFHPEHGLTMAHYHKGEAA